MSKDDELKSNKSAAVDSVESDAASIHQMELLSELQAARRTLLQEKENLLHEQRSLASEIETMKTAVSEQIAVRNQSKRIEQIKLEELKRQSDQTIRELERVILEKDEVLLLM